MFNLEPINKARIAAGFLTIEETMALMDNGNLLLDPFSILVSKGVCLGENNLIYPGVALQASGEGKVEIENGNIFHSGTMIDASHGRIEIGSDNQFGEGGFIAKANQPGADIHIGSACRFLNNSSVFGQSRLEDGSQLLGNITVVSCLLKAGGSHRTPEPALRAGLLKGFGTAQNLTVEQGHVIAGSGVFSQSMSVPQSTYHPKH